jgi:hypothetical protein
MRDDLGGLFRRQASWRDSHKTNWHQIEFPMVFEEFKLHKDDTKPRWYRAGTLP